MTPTPSNAKAVERRVVGENWSGPMWLHSSVMGEDGSSPALSKEDGGGWRIVAERTASKFGTDTAPSNAKDEALRSRLEKLAEDMFRTCVWPGCMVTPNPMPAQGGPFHTFYETEPITIWNHLFTPSPFARRIRECLREERVTPDPNESYMDSLNRLIPEHFPGVFGGHL
jgi:hypothetical protein